MRGHDINLIGSSLFQDLCSGNKVSYIIYNVILEEERRTKNINCGQDLSITQPLFFSLFISVISVDWLAKDNEHVNNRIWSLHGAKQNWIVSEVFVSLKYKHVGKRFLRASVRLLQLVSLFGHYVKLAWRTGALQGDLGHCGYKWDNYKYGTTITAKTLYTYK